MTLSSASASPQSATPASTTSPQATTPPFSTTAMTVAPAQPRDPRARKQSEATQTTHMIDWRVNPRSYEFMGAVFDPLTPMQTLQRAKWMTTEHSFRYVVTPNVDHLVRLAREPEVYRPLYDASWLSVCDSRILEAMAKLSGLPLTAVPGSDLTQQIFDNIITAHDPITIIGADSEIVNRIKAMYGLTEVYHYMPPMGLRHKPEELAACARFASEHPSRYVFICVGSPQQEMVAKACLDRGDCVGFGLCVGASLDFIGGRVKRAPKWMQRSRLEWLHRLASEPKRLWKRYLIEGPTIFWLWAKWIIRSRKSRDQSLG